jgi:hypothetical protein
MTTSGVFSPTSTRDIIVYGALRLVGAYASEDTPRTQQVTDATIALNLMLKSWQTSGFIWLREFKSFALAAATASYDLPDAGTFAYRPTRIYAATVKDAQGQEILLQALSRADYMGLPNKTQAGRPNSFYYDPQHTTGKIYLWPVPSDATLTLVLDVDKPFEILNASGDTFDCPDEWIEPIKYGLATRLAPEYGIPLAERQLLAAEYMSLRQGILDYNFDYTSTFLGRDDG